MAFVSQAKKDTVKEFTALLLEYPIVGIVNMEDLPAPQLQTMRALLREDVELRMTKRRLIKIAIDAVKDKKPGIEKLLDVQKSGMPALLFTKENPFKLYKKINKNKSAAPAKAGQIAPNDIEVKAGPTSFMPGPIIGELGAVGIKSGVEGGKVAIKENAIVVKAGEEITENVASILARLDIQPMEVGLDLTAMYEDGTLYTKDVLAVDESKYIADITNGSRWAFNLAVEVGFPTSVTLPVLITKAHSASRNLAVEAGILASGVVDMILAKAHSQMMGLKQELNMEE